MGMPTSYWFAEKRQSVDEFGDFPGGGYHSRYYLGMASLKGDDLCDDCTNRVSCYQDDPHGPSSRLLKKTRMLRCAQSPRSNVPPKYASARRFFARLASEIFLTSLQTDFFNNLLVSIPKEQRK